MTAERAALIADLEAAPCGSPELDARVAIELGWTRVDHLARRYTDAAGSHDTEPAWAEWFDPGGGSMKFGCLMVGPPPWTTNTDAALTLADDRLNWCIERRAYNVFEALFYGYESAEATCATAPLAIVAAALKIGG